MPAGGPVLVEELHHLPAGQIEQTDRHVRRGPNAKIDRRRALERIGSVLAQLQRAERRIVDAGPRRRVVGHRFGDRDVAVRRNVVVRDHAVVVRPDHVGIGGRAGFVEGHEVGINARRVLRGHDLAPIVGIQLARACEVFEVLGVIAQRIGARDRGAVLCG